MSRCQMAIKFGVTLSTRCMKGAGHVGNAHEGRGLEAFPYQRVEWFDGDRREFETERDDNYAWEEPL